jgi:nitrogen fixation/metabolism regulation signal transduction histidine kinase
VHTIRTTLVQAFLAVIFCLIATVLISFLLFNQASSQYSIVVENLVNQSRLINLTYALIDAYKNLYKSIDDPQTQAIYAQVKSDIIATLSDKNNIPISKDAQATYTGLGIIVQNIISETDQGLESTRNGDITSTSVHYDNANRQFAFLKELASEHYAQTLKDISSLFPAIKANAARAYATSAIIAVLVIVGSLIYAFYFSLSITRPIVDLTYQAKQIATGNVTATTKSDISKTNNEISSLSSSFNLMVTNLRDKITQLDNSNKALEQSKKDIEQQSESVRQMNDLMTGRELRMIELKNEIETLKQIQKANPT